MVPGVLGHCAFPSGFVQQFGCEDGDFGAASFCFALQFCLQLIRDFDGQRHSDYLPSIYK